MIARRVDSPPRAATPRCPSSFEEGRQKILSRPSSNEEGQAARQRGQGGAGLQRRAFIALAASGAAGTGGHARAEEPARVVVVIAGNTATTGGLLAAFRRGLAALGWVEGHNLTIEIHSLAGDLTRLPALAEAVVRGRPQLIVTSTSTIASGIRRATTTIPIVKASSSNPVGTGLAASLARPGGNITGLSGQSSDVFGKLFELMRELAPGAKRVLALRGAASISGAEISREFAALLRRFDLVGHVFTIDGDRSLAPLQEELDRAPPDALIAFADPVIFARQRELIALAATRRLPLVSIYREFTQEGALASYGSSLARNWERAASFVDRILKGGDPATMPIEQPTLFELVINQRTARSLGITVSPLLLARADEVIE